MCISSDAWSSSSRYISFSDDLKISDLSNINENSEIKPLGDYHLPAKDNGNSKILDDWSNKFMTSDIEIYLVY
jgi:hypothetical protein